MDNQLPPLPRSDAEALEGNVYDGYYKVKAREFWGNNEITRTEVKPDVKCEHEFKSTRDGAECQRCHFGLIGQIEVRNGKLFHKGEPLGL